MVRIINFEGLAGWMREQEIHQKTIENDVKIRPKIDAKSIQISYSKKWCQKHRKSSKMGLEREPKTVQNPFENRCRNLIRKKVRSPVTEDPCESQGWVQFKRLLRRVTYGNNLTREKNHIGREQHYESNTPRAPSGPEWLTFEGRCVAQS